MMRNYVLISIFYALFIFVYFLYYGVTTPPPLGDSHDYHLPIAESLLNGSFLSLPEGINYAVYYPGSSNAILSLFLLLNIPINYFGLLSWIILFFLSIKMGRHFGLEKSMAIVYAVAFCSCLTLLRQIATQSIDLWMAVWFMLAILLLEKPKNDWKYFLSLGAVFGMIIGSKYSGPLYIFVIALVYLKRIIPFITWKRVLSFLIPFVVLGLFWYIRNYILYGSPFYPASFLGSTAHPDLKLADYALWKTPFVENYGLLKIIEALISEYLVWAFSLLIIPVYLYLKVKKKQIIRSELFERVVIIAILTLTVSLLLPIPTINIVSNMRYLFPVFMFSILAVFLVAQKYKMNELISLIAILNIMTIQYMIYHPKLIIIYFALVLIILWKRKHFLDKLLKI